METNLAVKLKERSHVNIHSSLDISEGEQCVKN